MSSTKVPVLSEYKKRFLLKRLTETFLGGLQVKFENKVPSYVYFFQVMVWVFPVITIGTIVVVSEFSGLDVLYASITVGILNFLCMLFSQLFHLIKKRQNAVGFKQKDKKTKLTVFNIQEENIIDFTSLLSYNFYSFIIPPKKKHVTTLFHSLMYGVVSGFSVWYLQPSTLNLLFNNNVVPVVLVLIFSWVTLAVSLHPLVVSGGSFTETATYRLADGFQLEAASRAFHVCLFYSLHLFEKFYSELQIANQVLHLLFLFLPILWFIAVIPTIEPFILWIFEQTLVFAFGGSPMATSKRIILSTVLSGILFIPACFMPTILSLVLYTTGISFLLSLNFLEILKTVVIKLKQLFGNKNKIFLFDVNGIETKSSLMLKEPLFLVLMFVTSIVVSGLLSFYQKTIVSNNLNLAYEIVFIITFIILLLLQEVQKVYVVFGLIKNDIYKKENSKKISTKYSALKICGYFHYLFFMVLNPIIMTSYGCLYVITIDNPTPSFTTALYATHFLRMIWQRNKDALSILAIFSFIDLVVSNNVVNWVWWTDTSPGLLLILLDLLLDRLVKFVEIIWFMINMTVVNYTDKKLKRKSSLKIFVLNILFSPLLLCMAAVAAALSTSVLPLFTLPIFTLAFPRPSKFWPSTKKNQQSVVSGESATYDHMFRGVKNKIVKGESYGAYAPFISGCTNLQFYLLRSQQRTMFVQMLEGGYNYRTMVCKGLELEETSCHAAEITQVDDLCALAFDQSDDRVKTSLFNKHGLMSALKLLDHFDLESYTDATTSLNGIINNLDAMQRFKIDYVTSLAWLLLRHRDKWFFPEQFATPATPSRVATPQSPPPNVVTANDDFWDAISSSSNETAFDDVTHLGLPVVSNTQVFEDPALTERKEDAFETFELKSNNGENSVCLHDLVSKSEMKEQRDLLQLPDDYFKIIFDNFNECDDATIKKEIEKVVFTSYVLMISQANIGTEKISAQTICKGFLDEANTFMTTQAEIFMRNYPQIFQLSQTALRYSLKLMYDRVIMASDDNPKVEDVLLDLEEYENVDNHVGIMTSQDWCDHIKRGTNQLFTVYFDKHLNEYKARTLLRHNKVETSIASASSSVVRSIWANLNFELLYATNDDEERLSIQAHPVLFRNILTQCADQPLGYHIYQSPITTVSTVSR